MTYSSLSRGIGDPDCPVCGGLGYVSYDLPDEHPDFGRMFPCECREGRHYEERIARLRELGGLEALADKRLDTFNPDGIGLNEREQASLRAAFDTVAAYAQNLQGWLVLRGGYGVGKTHLAAAIANHQLDVGQEAVFVSVPDLLDHLRGTYSVQDEEEGFTSRFGQVRATPLLVLDDLGAESPTNWAVEKLYQIFNHRYNARLATVITTNFQLEDLERRLRSRLTDPDLSQIVTITARDYRGSGGIAGQSDLSIMGMLGHLRFDNFELREDALQSHESSGLGRIKEAAITYAREPQGWFVILGNIGCGKTHLAAAIANYRQDVGAPVLFVTVPDLLDHLRATYSPDSRVSYDKRLTEIRNAPFLVLDDLGTESATPWAREKLYQVFNHRYNALLPTVVTSTQTLNEMDPRLSGRLRDKRRCRVWALSVQPYRNASDVEYN